jgi:hypothetical protein
MGRMAMTEAEARYLDRVVDDCVEILGPGVDIDDVEVFEDFGDFGVVLRLRYHLGGVSWSSEGHGPSVTAAHGDLRQRLVLDRLRMATVAVFRSAG